MNRTETRASADQRYLSVHIGLVVAPGKQSAQGGPKARTEQGEVLLTFPWYDDDTPIPARVATLYSGNGFGSVWTPEVDTEVLVCFENGDMRSPIVIGCLYNGVDKPPAARSDSSDRKILRTKGGHQITFDDGPDKRGIELATKDGHVVHIDDDKDQLTVSLSGGPSITLTTNELALHGRRVTIKADDTVEVDAPTIRLN